MQLTSILAVYLLFWTMTLFVVLPFHAHTAEEVGGERIPGQADSAPHRFRAGRIVLWTSLVSALLFGLYYANYVLGWIPANILDWIVPPAG